MLSHGSEWRVVAEGRALPRTDRAAGVQQDPSEAHRQRVGNGELMQPISIGKKGRMVKGPKAIAPNQAVLRLKSRPVVLTRVA